LGVDLQHDVVEAARTAQAAGYASLWTYERLLFPKTPAEPYAELPNVPWPGHSRQAADSLAVLTAAAVATEKVGLGVSVLVAALHTPIQLAKALATIDQISGGRMIAGMGPGWSSDEFQAAGATGADRGRFLDETLDVFDAVQTAAEGGADEVIIDLNLQDWFTSTKQMLETVAIRERAAAS
jgi:alkanesulfonate monooxygenase SsuD/methylene tetrahydromethanopterin reductase-like flavin-dependent oxidoreductase (luciferase family)